MDTKSYSLNCGNYIAVIWRVNAEIDLKTALTLFLERNREKIECFWIASTGPALELLVRCVGNPEEGLGVIKQRPLRVYSSAELTIFMQSIANSLLGQIGNYANEVKRIQDIEIRIYRNYDELHPDTSDDVFL